MTNRQFPSSVLMLFVALFAVSSFACSASLNLASTSTSAPTNNPVPTDTPKPPPSPTPPYSLDEQNQLAQWCDDFTEIYNANDAVRADVQDWLDGQGQSLTQNDIDKTQEFSDRLSELDQQIGGLARLPRVRDINDAMSESLFTEQAAYDSLHRAYTGGTQDDFDTYVEDKRQAEEATSHIIDMFNDTMLEVDIAPVTCKPTTP